MSSLLFWAPLQALPADPNALLTEARLAYEQNKFSESERLLEIFVLKHPGVPGYLDAHRLLAETRIAQEKFKQAIPPMEYYVRATSTPSNRLKLGELLLRAGSPSAALMTAKSVLERNDADRIAELRADALMLKANAQFELGQYAEVERTLDETPTTLVRAQLLRVRLRAIECSRFPSSRVLSEEQAIHQFERKASCLEDALSRYKQISTPNATSGLPSPKTIREQLRNQARDLLRYAESPPMASRGKSNRLYAKELSALLRKKFEESRKQWDSLVADAELKKSLGELSSSDSGKR